MFRTVIAITLLLVTTTSLALRVVECDINCDFFRYVDEAVDNCVRLTTLVCPAPPNTIDESVSGGFWPDGLSNITLLQTGERCALLPMASYAEIDLRVRLRGRCSARTFGVPPVAAVTYDGAGSAVIAGGGLREKVPHGMLVQFHNVQFDAAPRQADEQPLEFFHRRELYSSYRFNNVTLVNWTRVRPPPRDDDEERAVLVRAVASCYNTPSFEMDNVSVDEYDGTTVRVDGFAYVRINALVVALSNKCASALYVKMPPLSKLRPLVTNCRTERLASATDKWCDMADSAEIRIGERDDCK